MDGWIDRWINRVCKHWLLSVTVWGGQNWLVPPLLPSPFPSRGPPALCPPPSHGSRDGPSSRGSLPSSALPCTSALPGHLRAILGCQPGALAPKPAIVSGRGKSHHKFRVGLFPCRPTWQIQCPCSRLDGHLATGSTGGSAGIGGPWVTPRPQVSIPPCPPLPIGLRLLGVRAPRRGQPRGWGCPRPPARPGTQRSPASFSPGGAGTGTATMAEAGEGTRAGAAAWSGVMKVDGSQSHTRRVL